MCKMGCGVNKYIEVNNKPETAKSLSNGIKWKMKKMMTWRAIQFVVRRTAIQ